MSLNDHSWIVAVIVQYCGEESIWNEKHAFQRVEVTVHQCLPLLHPRLFFP